MDYRSKLLNEAMKEIQSSGKNPISNNVSLLMSDPESEPVIQIDSDLRKITIPDELKDIAVAGDHLSETVYFTCPRYFDGNDLSEHKCIIRYINAGNEYGEADVIDLTSETDTIKFGWSLDNYVTRYSGSISFTVQFETVDDTVKYQWQTTPAELNILAALNIEETITDKDDTLFRTLSNQVATLQEKVKLFEEKMDILESLSQQISIIQNDVNYLKENVVYTLSEL